MAEKLAPAMSAFRRAFKPSLIVVREVKLLRCVLAIEHLIISFQWVTR
jgi:hypothetical protein